MATNRYFVYDPENGSEFFASEKEALDYAEETLDLYREAAQDDGWDEEVGIVVGKITHYLEKCNVVTKKGELDEDGNDENGVYWGNAEYDEIHDYRIVRKEDSNEARQ